MRLSGILTVARLEFRLRIRAGRWRWLVGAWFVVLLLITVLVRAAAGQQNIAGDEPALGAAMFGVRRAGRARRWPCWWRRRWRPSR